MQGITKAPLWSQYPQLPAASFTAIKDSPAMQADIRNADVIVEVNKEKVETVKGYQQQLKSCKVGETVKVKAMRQGTEGYVEVSFDVALKAR